jgi:predicted transposase YdaD
MPLPFDATLKDIVQKFTRDFEEQLGLIGPQPVTVLNVDLSTVSAATDFVLGYGEPPVRLVDLNFQTSRDVELAQRLLMYNALLHHRYGVPVHSVVILLRPAADDATLTGELRYQAWPRRGKMLFKYEVVRLWQKPVRRFLAGHLGTLPLAPLCRLPENVPMEEALADVIRRMDERLQHEVPPQQAALLLNTAYILTGLRVPRPVLGQLFQGVRAMRESSAYQAILDEGRQEGRQEGMLRLLLRQGRQKFGSPSDAIMATLTAITDLDRLERMGDQVFNVSSWDELLATP